MSHPFLLVSSGSLLPEKNNGLSELVPFAQNSGFLEIIMDDRVCHNKTNFDYF